MKLTKLQRHTAYVLMLAELNSDVLEYYATDGFCYLISEMFGLKDKEGTYELIINELFPELQRKKPETIFGTVTTLWFEPNKFQNGIEQRKELLRQCIKETS